MKVWRVVGACTNQLDLVAGWQEGVEPQDEVVVPLEQVADAANHARGVDPAMGEHNKHPVCPPSCKGQYELHIKYYVENGGLLVIDGQARHSRLRLERLHDLEELVVDLRLVLELGLDLRGQRRVRVSNTQYDGWRCTGTRAVPPPKAVARWLRRPRVRGRIVHQENHL